MNEENEYFVQITKVVKAKSAEEAMAKSKDAPVISLAVNLRLPPPGQQPPTKP